ncbi:YceI family protein [Sediminicola luteus]|uniref:YceI family protein n=1 Tax=Sediminicola luteus TaxID=319238 RepID=A0ABV2TRQ6_9FLAO
MRYSIYYKILVLFIIFWISPVNGQFFQTSSAQISFFSKTPLEDIKAKSPEGISVINSSTGEILFKIDIRSFQFKKSLMQEHFNENYMESEKYPTAEFKGISMVPIDITSIDNQEVVFKGDFTVHGVTKERELKTTIKLIDGNTLVLESDFQVKCEDHNIKIPRILWQNIAEIIDVNVNATYQIVSK